MTMTNRERFLRAMHFEPVDHPPFFMDGPWEDTFELWVGQGYPKGMPLADFLKVDALEYHNCPIDTFLIPRWEPKIVYEDDEHTVKTDCYGARIRTFKNHTSMPMWLDYAVKSDRDLLALVERLQWNGGAGRVPANWDAQVRRWRKDGKGVVVQGGSYYGILRNLMGVEALSMMLYDAPEAIKRYNDAYHRIIMAVLEKAFSDLKGEILYVSFGEDFAYHSAPLLSPAMYREFVMPYQKEVVDFARSRGVDLFFFDSDGNLNEMLPHLLEAGINLIYPVECAADMDPLVLRKTYGKALRMIGGIDKREIARGKENIRREMHRKVPPLIAEGGFLPRIDHSVGTDISLENFLYYFQTLKEIYGLS